MIGDWTKTLDKKLDKGQTDYHVENKADYDPALNVIEDKAPEIMKELRRDTIDIILRVARNPGEQVVKVAKGSYPVVTRVRGYATFLRFIKGSTLAELEQRLGFRAGILQQHGAHVYTVDALALDEDNVSPRGNSDWSAGVSPRDLDNLSKKDGVKVGHHRDYPPASKPVIQFAILQEVDAVGKPVFLKQGDRL